MDEAATEKEFIVADTEELKISEATTLRNSPKGEPALVIEKPQGKSSVHRFGRNDP